MSIADRNTSQNIPRGKKSRLNEVQIAVSKVLLTNLLQLIREWVAETQCKPISVSHWEDAEGNFILSVSFTNPECAGAFRYGFTRS
jgi:hypothetical protein